LHWYPLKSNLFRASTEGGLDRGNYTEEKWVNAR
jgi:hypothetical protein